MRFESFHKVIHGFHESCGVDSLVLDLDKVCILLELGGVRSGAFGIRILEDGIHLERYGELRILRIKFDRLYPVLLEIFKELGVFLGLCRTVVSEDHVVEKKDHNNGTKCGEDHHPRIVPAACGSLVILVLLIVFQSKNLRAACPRQPINTVFTLSFTITYRTSQVKIP